MAFQNFSTIKVVTCTSCGGTGCTECKNFGVYGISGDNTLVFDIPPTLEIEIRKKAKIVFLIKQASLLAGAFLITFLLLNFINSL